MAPRGNNDTKVPRVAAPLSRAFAFVGAMIAFVAGIAMPETVRAEDITIRVGYFRNVTHVQAIVALNMERHGRNWFAERLGTGVTIRWRAFEAGPTAMQAIIARSLDFTYAGPSSI